VFQVRLKSGAGYFYSLPARGEVFMSFQGHRLEAWKLIVIGTGAWFLSGSLSMVAGAEMETRLFTVRIDGKSGGSYQMTLGQPDAHTFTVVCQANVSTSYLFIKYRYTYQGSELWKDGRLTRLESKTNDDGKQFEVLAQAAGDALRIRVNGEEHASRPGVWTTTYWHAPEPKSVNQAVELIDCDTGKNLRGTLQYVGTQSLTLAGEPRNCAHYSIRGAVHVDLWYDGQQRLVRELSVEDGHRILIELARIGR
jgi:hypothetical protein